KRARLAAAAAAEVPASCLDQSLLVLSTEARLRDAAYPKRPTETAMETIPAQKRRFTLPDIAKAGHVDAVGPVADRIPIGGAVDSTVCSAAHDVIHQVLPDLAARVGDSREQEDARGLDRRGTEEDDPRLELERVLRLPVDHADPGRSGPA